MLLIWLIVLVSYGLIRGFGEIDPLAWLLLIPMYSQDANDWKVKKTARAAEEKRSWLGMIRAGRN